MRLSVLVPFLLLTVGCRSVHSVSLTQIPPQRDKIVKAEVSKFIFLGLNFDNDYVDGLVEKLKDQCKDGQIKGILTKDEVVNYFLMLAYSREITAKGYCVINNSKDRMSSLQVEPQL